MLSNFNFVNDIISAGGDCYLRGGCLRDTILKENISDYDLLVTRVSPDTLKNILSKYGEIIDHKYIPGAYKLVTEKYGVLDICFPVRSTKDGYINNSQMTLEDYRIHNYSNFTINSLLFNLHTQELYDVHTSIDDILNKRIKLIPYYLNNPTDLKYELIVILHAIRFVSVLSFEIESNTYSMFGDYVSDLIDKIPEPLLYNEFHKIILGNNRPRALYILNELKILQPLVDIYNRDIL